MKYTSGAAFRQALETRLKQLQRTEQIPLVRLRKQVAFERFIARLQGGQPDQWILKGGLAMQLRLGLQSRTTKDIDLLRKGTRGYIYDPLVNAAAMDLGDWFTFEVGQPDEEPEDDFGGNRYPIVCRLDGRTFEQFHVDVGVSDLVVTSYDFLQFEPVLDFADISATSVPCYPITQQIAEKLHALTREYTSGRSTRTKDIVDILLLACHGPIDGSSLSRAIASTFDLRATHPVPNAMPPLSQSLHREYNRMAKEVGLKFKYFSTAEPAFMAFINPILQGEIKSRWNNEIWKWERLD